jgi:hypothetical protein
MPPVGRLRAWVERSSDTFLASYVGEFALRPPATRAFASKEDAVRWVELQGSKLGVTIDWVEPPPPQALAS